MSPVSPKMRDFAGRLIAHEAKQNKSSPKKTLLNFPLIEKLRPFLTTLMGSAGFHALLSRSLALSREEFPWLRAVHVKADGSLDGLGELKTQVDADEFLEGRMVMLAQLLGLLVAFIGEILTLQLVLEVWPKLSLQNFDFFGKEDKNEKTK